MVLIVWDKWASTSSKEIRWICEGDSDVLPETQCDSGSVEKGRHLIVEMKNRFSFERKNFNLVEYTEPF